MPDNYGRNKFEFNIPIALGQLKTVVHAVNRRSAKVQFDWFVEQIKNYELSFRDGPSYGISFPELGIA